MCGIGGFHGDLGRLDPAAVLDAMDTGLHHRGPDQGGRLHEPGVGLLIRRLSIIDLAHGQQPIASEDGQVVTVFNGEIYNHVELRQDLESRGHTFRSRADTEVIVHLYEEEGLDFLHRLRGMFAIALLDRRNGRIVLARDRLGIKPLYTARLPAGGLLFASEIRTLLDAGVDDAPDARGMAAYFRLGYTAAPLTCYRNIRAIPPGSLLLVDGKDREPRRWWSVSPREKRFRGSENEARERLRELVRDAVRSRLISDVPLGAFLSGGLDSTLVVGVMADLLDRPVETFTIGFEEPEFDETPISRIASRHFSTNAHEQRIAAGSVEVLDDVLQGFGQPFADASAVPTLLVSRLARRHVTVALSGDGGDEMFGGYMRYARARSQQWIDRVPRGLRGALAGMWPEGARGSGFLRIAADEFGARYLENTSLTTPGERSSLLEPELLAASESHPYHAAEPLVRDHLGGMEQVDDLLYLDLMTYLPDDILAKVDRMSMSCSLEARVPLLDHHLVEFVFSLPLSWRMGEVGTKKLLREAFEGLYPPSILERGKRGFGLPLGLWLAGPLGEHLRALPDSDAVRSGPLRRKAVQALVDEHLSGRRDRSRKLWTLIVFDRWWSARGAARPGAVAGSVS